MSDVDECFIDWDCVGDMKCCSNECYKVCTAPALLIGRLVAAAGSVTSICYNSRMQYDTTATTTTWLLERVLNNQTRILMTLLEDTVDVV